MDELREKIEAQVREEIDGMQRQIAEHEKRIKPLQRQHDRAWTAEARAWGDRSNDEPKSPDKWQLAMRDVETTGKQLRGVYDAISRLRAKIERLADASEIERRFQKRDRLRQLNDSRPTDLMPGETVEERIINTRVAGGTYPGIAAALNVAGVPTRKGGKQWYPPVVRRICIKAGIEGVKPRA